MQALPWHKSMQKETVSLPYSEPALLTQESTCTQVSPYHPKSTETGSVNS
jgi:hypothetical protein